MSWTVYKLEDIAKIIAGQSPESKFYNQTGEGIPFFQGKADFTNEFPNVRYYCTQPTKLAKTLDILLSVRAPVGPTNICNVDACIGRGLAAIRAKKVAHFKYLYYFFKFIEKKLSDSGNGSTFSAITISDIKNIQVPLPPLSTQRRIAEILDTADALRRKDQELLRRYDELAQAIFIDMFGDPVRNEMGWEVKKLEDCSKQMKGSIRTGPFGSQLLIEELIESGVPVYGIDNVHSTGFIWAKPKFVSAKKYEELIGFKIFEGDVLVTRTGTIGRSCVAPKNIPESIIGPNLLRVSLNPKILLPEVLSFMLNNFDTVKNKIKSMSPGATVAVFNSDNLKGLELITPPHKLQNTFLDIYKNINTQKLTFYKNESESLFNRLLQKSFSGELIA